MEICVVLSDKIFSGPKIIPKSLKYEKNPWTCELIVLSGGFQGSLQIRNFRIIYQRLSDSNLYKHPSHLFTIYVYTTSHNRFLCSYTEILWFSQIISLQVSRLWSLKGKLCLKQERTCLVLFIALDHFPVIFSKVSISFIYTLLVCLFVCLSVCIQ